MAGSDNTVTLVGNLTKDPELRFTNSGKAYAQSGLAITNRRRNADGQWEDGDTHFFNLKVWDSLAENFAESCLKGTRVIVTGRLAFRQWETDDGDKRSIVEIVVEAVGPELRWATADVTRQSGKAAASDVPDYAPENEEPF